MLLQLSGLVHSLPFSLERHVQLILHLHRKVDTRLQISTFGILENLE
ncbi:hypothetical protein V6Z11_A01G133400 [Gossypium hirsutum]